VNTAFHLGFHEVDPLLATIRKAELDAVLPHLPTGGKVLELGAGTGFQAMLLGEQGYDVVALDVPESSHRENAVFAVGLFDGVHIPYPDATFDAVFSSNVLEHAESLDALLAESARVLKEGGIAVHILPTAAWRFWTNAAHYVWVFKSVWAVLRGTAGPEQPSVRALGVKPKKTGLLRMARVALFPVVHGCRGNFLSEILLFTARRWESTFKRAGFRLKARESIGLFYTGRSIPGPQCPMERRRLLARLLGSSSDAHVLAKGQKP
jgi:SAM-dependent methyltransferase